MRIIYHPGCGVARNALSDLCVLHVVMDDGTEKDCKAGDVSLLPTGHDAWVVGNEPVVVVDFQGMIDYAKQVK
jgi:hypothetical protein